MFVGKDYMNPKLHQSQKILQNMPSGVFKYVRYFLQPVKTVVN